jgi:hypothetical protein
MLIQVKEIQFQGEERKTTEKMHNVRDAQKETDTTAARIVTRKMFLWLLYQNKTVSECGVNN